jgi:hypothetical protein
MSNLDSTRQRNPPRAPITNTQTTNLLNEMEALTNDYLTLITTYDISVPAVGEAFNQVGLYRNNRDVQDMLDRTNNLYDRVQNGYGSSAARTRDIQEEYDRLVRMHARTRDNLDHLQEQLESSFRPMPPAVGRRDQPTQPSSYPGTIGGIQDPGPSHPNRLNPHNPTSDEIFRLRGEIRALRQENSDLNEEPKEARAIIRSLEDRLEEGEVRGGKRRRL